jgi:hypothetical protein
LSNAHARLVDGIGESAGIGERGSGIGISFEVSVFVRIPNPGRHPRPHKLRHREVKRSCARIRGVGESVRASDAAEPAAVHVRDLWTLYGTQATCTAAIYRTEAGLELRVALDGELTHTQLSRFGEQPLIMRADRVRAELLEQGWFERPPGSAPHGDHH